MEIILNKKPKGVTIIQGFPGIGLIGTISTEFLMEHLNIEQIGKVLLDDVPAILALHDGRIIEPLGIYYAKEYNIVIIHGLNTMLGNEWEISKAILDIGKKLEAKEIISLEGVGSTDESDNETDVYYYASHKANDKKMASLKFQKLEDGIIMGITSALMIQNGKIPLSCFFAKTHSKLPDSKAAAEIIKALDKYLNLKVDYKPLIKRAEEFEEKLKELLWKGKKMTELQEKKRLDYLG